MITPSEFVVRWEQFRILNPVLAHDEDYSLRVAKADDVRVSNLPLSVKEFLLEAGLPKSFSGLIWFRDPSEGLKRIWEVYRPSSWSLEEKEGPRQYLLVGADDQNNPICSDESKNGQIVVLDHDDYFSPWRFVNSSIGHLGEFLLAIGASTPGESLKKLLERIDSPAVQEGAFWSTRLR